MAKFVELLHWTDELGIPAVTCWLLSKENLERPAAELEPYYEVLVELFEHIPEVLSGRDMSVRFIGSVDQLPPAVSAAAKRLEERLPEGANRVTIALAYGGRQEIVDATRDLIGGLLDDGVEPAELASRISAEALAGHMYTADLPDPDLVIRTSGEARLSGFLLWQSAYAEYVFVDVYWPAFRRVDFLRALRNYTQRERRFGR